MQPINPFHPGHGPAPDPTRAREVELVLSQLTTLPTLSPVATRVLALASASEPDFDAIIELIESDPALSARTLALCKKAAFGISNPITSVRRAAALLGIEAVQSSLLSVQIYEVLGGDARLGENRSEQSGFDRDGFWRHAMGVGCAAQLIARQRRELGVSPEEAFTAGLIHDLGKLVLDWLLPRTYGRVIELARSRCTDIAQVERSLIGLDHHVAGKRLGEHWGLPHVLQDAMWLHAQSPDSMPDVPHRNTLIVVAAGDALARRLHIGWSGNDEPAPSVQELARWVGLETAQLDSLCEQVLVEVARRAQALGLGETSERQQVLSGLARANERLAHLHARASERGEQSRKQSRVLESLATFTRTSASEPGVSGVLACVGKCVTTLAGDGFVAALHQTRPGESWRIVRLDKPSDTRHELEPPRDARGKPMDLRSIGTGESLGGAIGLLTWLSEHLMLLGDCPDLRGLRFVPLISGTGPAALLVHEQDLVEACGSKPGHDALVGAWTSAIAGATQHEGSRRLAEALAETARTLAHTQSALTEAQSMARLGELTAGAAHELNNPLTVICGRAQIMSERLVNDRDKADARTIAEAAARLTNLISNLHLVARPPKCERRICTVSDVLTKAGAMAQQRALLGRGVKPAQTAITIHAGLGEINADEAILTRVIAELACNAIESGATVVDLRAMVQSPGDELVFSVCDDGPGLTPAAMAHAFDPFFSEKPAGRQSGLGLAIARGLSQAHQAELRLSAGPGGGTVASVRLGQWRVPASARSIAA